MFKKKKIKFHIPHFVEYLEINNILISCLNNDQIKKFFRDDIAIGSVYGTFPGAIWNGGRLSLGFYTIQDMNGIVEFYNSKGIPLRFTFTNSLIQKEHLSDVYCNTIMRVANNGMNEVLCNSKILEDYLRDKYPNYKYILSTTTQTRGLDVINRTTKEYDCVVLDYNDNKKFNLLKNISDKSKIEILLNETCNPNCPFRKQHYEYISRKQLSCEAFGLETDYSCRYDNTNSNPYDAMNRCSSTFIKPEELDNYIKMGFENFKLEGRGLPTIYTIEGICMYMSKPEYKDFVRYELLGNIEELNNK